MQRTTTREQRRLALQAALDAAKTQEERNRLGQFATPTSLAWQIVLSAVRCLPDDEPVRFLDPAIGTGAFFSALESAVAPSRIDVAEGYEVDEHYAAPARALWTGTALRIHTEDFTVMPGPSPDQTSFNIVVCNPPYVRHHHIGSAEKRRLRSLVEKSCAIRLSGLAGLYCYFLLLAHQWMAEGGVGAWLVPSEFMDVNYGEAVKEYLRTRVTLLRVHRFDPEDVQFGDALVSSAVVLFRNQDPPSDHAVQFTEGGSLRRPLAQRRVRARQLHPPRKWGNVARHMDEPRAGGVTLGDLFTIKRGVATGGNRFFILPDEAIRERDLPRHMFIPILPSPRFLDEDEVRADAEGTPLLKKRLFLLNCSLPEQRVEAQYPALWRYLLSGIPDVAERYLCRHRSPWYSQENRPPAKLLCTYMGRPSPKNDRIFRFILNHSLATAANVYLLLYPRPAVGRAFWRPDLIRTVWALLNETSVQSLARQGRVYGGGMYKLEPGELAQVPADSLLRAAPSLREGLLRQGDLFEHTADG